MLANEIQDLALRSKQEIDQKAEQDRSAKEKLRRKALGEFLRRVGSYDEGMQKVSENLFETQIMKAIVELAKNGKFSITIGINHYIGVDSIDNKALDSDFYSHFQKADSAKKLRLGLQKSLKEVGIHDDSQWSSEQPGELSLEGSGNSSFKLVGWQTAASLYLLAHLKLEAKKRGFTVTSTFKIKSEFTGASSDGDPSSTKYFANGEIEISWKKS